MSESEKLQIELDESKWIGWIESCKLSESNQPLLWIEQIDHQFIRQIRRIFWIYEYIFIQFEQIYICVFIIFALIHPICSANLQSNLGKSRIQLNRPCDLPDLPEGISWISSNQANWTNQNAQFAHHLKKYNIHWVHIFRSMFL